MWLCARFHLLLSSNSDAGRREQIPSPMRVPLVVLVHLHVPPGKIAKSLHAVEFGLRYAARAFRRQPRATCPIQTNRRFFRSPGPRGVVADPLPLLQRVRKIFLEHRRTAFPINARLTLIDPSCSPSKTNSIFPVKPGSTAANRKCAGRCISRSA